MHWAAQWYIPHIWRFRHSQQWLEAYGKLRELCEATNQRSVANRQDWMDWQEPPLPMTQLRFTA